MSWWDVTVGLHTLIVPLSIALRYDPMVAVAVVTVAPLFGSTIDLFVIGHGSDKAAITIGDRL